ncbi:hypothetical protein HC891_10890 [Candidatus Gracilibacteria bacterium]|nr:hypothetical protein [Candidatus Gracilibacteria bacterium]
MIARVERQPGDRRAQPSSHWVSSVVLPKPAGAATSVSFRASPSLSRAIRWGRTIPFGRGGGRYNFVASSGVGIAPL